MAPTTRTPQPRSARRDTASRTEEREFLASYDPGAFPRPSVSVDTVLMSVSDGSLWALLVRRAEHPYKGWWALPGGFVGMAESLDEAASRVLETKAGLGGVFVEQLYTFGEPKRDPRLRVITVAYYALVDWSRFGTATRERSDTCTARLYVPWEGEAGGPVEPRAADGEAIRLAFDHREILGMAVKRIRGKLGYAPIGFQLLAERFTLRQLQTVHETIAGKAFNKDSFRRRMLASGALEATGELESGVEYRPAELYRFREGAGR